MHNTFLPTPKHWNVEKVVSKHRTRPRTLGLEATALPEPPLLQSMFHGIYFNISERLQNSRIFYPPWRDGEEPEGENFGFSTVNSQA